LAILPVAAAAAAGRRIALLLTLAPLLPCFTAPFLPPAPTWRVAVPIPIIPISPRIAISLVIPAVFAVALIWIPVSRVYPPSMSVVQAILRWQRSASTPISTIVIIVITRINVIIYIELRVVVIPIRRIVVIVVIVILIIIVSVIIIRIVVVVWIDAPRQTGAQGNDRSPGQHPHEFASMHHDSLRNPAYYAAGVLRNRSGDSLYVCNREISRCDMNS